MVHISSINSIFFSRLLAKVTTLRCKIKAPTIAERIQKLTILPETWFSPETHQKISGNEKNESFTLCEISSSNNLKKDKVQQNSKYRKNWCPGIVKINKTLTMFFDCNCGVFCRTRNKNQTWTVSTFFVILPGHGMFSDISTAITFRPRSQAPSVSEHFLLLWKLRNSLSNYFLKYHEFSNLKVMKNLYCL